MKNQDSYVSILKTLESEGYSFIAEYPLPVFKGDSNPSIVFKHGRGLNSKKDAKYNVRVFLDSLISFSIRRGEPDQKIINILLDPLPYELNSLFYEKGIEVIEQICPLSIKSRYKALIFFEKVLESPLLLDGEETIKIDVVNDVIMRLSKLNGL